MIRDRDRSPRGRSSSATPTAPPAAVPGTSAVPGPPAPQTLVLHGQNSPGLDPSSSLSLPTSDDSAGPIATFAGDRPVESMDVDGIHVSQTNVQNNLTFDYHDEQ